MTTPDKKLEEIRDATRRANEVLKDIKRAQREVSDVYDKIQRVERNVQHMRQSIGQEFVKMGDALLLQIRRLVDAEVDSVAEEARQAVREAIKEVAAIVTVSRERKLRN